MDLLTRKELLIAGKIKEPLTREEVTYLNKKNSNDVSSELAKELNISSSNNGNLIGVDENGDLCSVEIVKLPSISSLEDGTYNLQVTISDGSATYSWEAVETTQADQ